MLEKLPEFLKWCNTRRKQFISILHQLKNSRSFSIVHCTVFALRPVVTIVPSLGEGQYRSLDREKQFATRRVLPRLAVGCGWPQSCSYYNASEAHHVKFTCMKTTLQTREICHRNCLPVVASAILGERCKACTFSVGPLWVMLYTYAYNCIYMSTHPIILTYIPRCKYTLKTLAAQGGVITTSGAPFTNMD